MTTFARRLRTLNPPPLPPAVALAIAAAAGAARQAHMERTDDEKGDRRRKRQRSAISTKLRALARAINNHLTAVDAELVKLRGRVDSIEARQAAAATRRKRVTTAAGVGQVLGRPADKHAT